MLLHIYEIQIIKQMNIFKNQKQIYRYREQTTVYLLPVGRGIERGRL